MVSSGSRRDLVKAVVTIDKKAGAYWDRVGICTSDRFNIETESGLGQGIPYRFCTRIQHANGCVDSHHKKRRSGRCASPG